MKKKLINPQSLLKPMEARLNKSKYVDVEIIDRPFNAPRTIDSISVHCWDDDGEEFVPLPGRCEKIGEAIANIPDLIKALQFVYQDNYDNLSVSSRMRIEEALESVL